MINYKLGVYYALILGLHGYTVGVHYWEVVPSDCGSDVRNTYIGIAYDTIDKRWNLGSDLVCCNFQGKFFY